MSLPTLSAMAVAAGLAGCADDPAGAPTPREGGPLARCDSTYADLGSARTMSLRQDVMPVFGLACTLTTQCHGATGSPKAGLFLGPVCEFDRITHECVFPETPNPARGSAPLTQGDVKDVLVNLLAPSATAPAVMRVARSDPTRSLLLDKLAGIQNEKGYACENQDPTRSRGACGEGMPLGTPLCSQSGGPDRFRTVAAWIAQGAADN